MSFGATQSQNAIPTISRREEQREREATRVAARERLSASTAAAAASQTAAAAVAPSSTSTASSSAKMNIDSIIEEENAEKEKLERAREEAAEKVPFGFESVNVPPKSFGNLFPWNF